MSGVSEIAAQLFFLVVLASGGGCWLWILTGRPPPNRGYVWLWFGLAGMALGALLLQSLLYCGVPLQISTWPVLAGAIVGGVIAVREWRAKRFASPPGMRREIGVGLVVFMVALAGQAPPLVQHGPARFYGTGSYDHANYVALADLFIGGPLAVQADTVEYRPWMVPVLKAKDQRITQSVLLGAVAVATRTSGQEAYGATNLFLIALAALATMGCLRAMGVPRWFAACAGLAAALSPALTRVHLEGYFSQTGSLFVLPALAGVFGVKGALRPEAKALGAVLLAYLASVYSEIAPFGFGLVAVLLVLKASSWRLRIRSLLQVFIGALLLNPGYWGRLAAFLLTQWQVAGGTDLDFSSRFPESGTWHGWGRLFFDGTGELGAQIAGIVWAALLLLGCCRLFRVRRPAIIVALGLGFGAFGILSLKSPFHGYIFTKLCIQFAPLLIAVAISGLLVLGSRRQWRGLWLRGAALLAVGACWWGAAPWRRQVMEPEGMLAQLASAGLLAVRQAVEANPERAYLVAADDPVLAQWLCYFGRKSDVVMDRRTVGGLIVTTETYACRRWSGSPDKLFWLDPERSGPVAAYEPAPALMVEGAQEVGDEDGGKYYVAGSSLELVLRREVGESARPIWLDFVVVPWHSDQPCQLELTDPAGRRWRLDVQRPGWSRWPVTAAAGDTRLTLSLSNHTANGTGPVALIKRLSVETAAALPPWQRIHVAERVP